MDISNAKLRIIQRVAAGQVGSVKAKAMADAFRAAGASVERNDKGWFFITYGDYRADLIGPKSPKASRPKKTPGAVMEKHGIGSDAVQIAQSIIRDYEKHSAEGSGQENVVLGGSGKPSLG